MLICVSLEYCFSVCSSRLKYDINKLDSVPRKFAKKIIYVVMQSEVMFA